MQALAWLGAVQAALLLSQREGTDAVRASGPQPAFDPTALPPEILAAIADAVHLGTHSAHSRLRPKQSKEQKAADCSAWAAADPAAVVPTPQQATWSGCCLALGKQTAIAAPPELQPLLTEVAEHLGRCGQDWDAREVVERIDVRVSPRRVPRADAFQLKCRKQRCRVLGNSHAGARYGLDALVQALGGGVAKAGFGQLHVEDWPEQPWRGLLLDVGRRFVPVDGVKQVLHGMAVARLNVLHLHLSDYCRFALNLPGFPELGDAAAPGADVPEPGAYSPADIAELVAYAGARGIRVVPEVDLPGHASALRPLTKRGLKFCDAKRSPLDADRDVLGTGQSDYIANPEDAEQLADDPDGHTRKVLGGLLTAVAALFPDPVLHVGADEAPNLPDCPQSYLAAWAVEFVQGLGKQPMAWEDIGYPASTGAPAADAETAQNFRLPPGSAAGLPLILQPRLRVSPEAAAGAAFIADRGVDLVASPQAHAYLDMSYERSPVRSFYYDVGTPGPQPAPGKPPTEGSDSMRWTPAEDDAERLRELGLPGARYRAAGGGSLLLKGARSGRYVAAGLAQLQESGTYEVAGSVLTLVPGAGRRGDAGRPGDALVFTTNSSGRVWAGQRQVAGAILSRVALPNPLAPATEPVENHRARLLGGEAAMWTDEYVATWQCGAWGLQVPAAPELWDRSMDAEFVESLQGMIWPRAAVFASALWNFDPLVDPDALARREAALLRARGITACPAGCSCTQSAACGKRYFP